MIRYYIDPNQQTSYWLDFELTKKYPLIPNQQTSYWLDFELTKKYPLITKQKRVYLEILDRNSLYTKVKLYLDDGMIVNCFLPRVWYNPIQISNFDDLLDGRFND